MRALWLCAAILGLALAAGAVASGNMAVAHGNVGNNASHSSRPAPGRSRFENGYRFGNGSRFGNTNPGGREYGSFNRFPRTRFVYALPVYGQQGDVEQEDADSGYDQPDYTQIEYVQTPTPPAPVIAPPKPAQIVQYATTGQPIEIPAGARVTKGSVYKYMQNGVSTYTNVPPPDTAHAKLLFGYTEAISSAGTHTMYRCTGSKPGNIGYSEAPVPNQNCKAISYADSAAN